MTNHNYQVGRAKKMLTGICKMCKGEFKYHPSNKAGKYCSKQCYFSDKEQLSKQAKKARAKQIELGINKQYLSDDKLLELWKEFKETKKSLRGIFTPFGYHRAPPKRLLKIIPKGEYEQYKDKNRENLKNYRYKRGVHYERKAIKELKKEGFLVVRSSRSSGDFDIWALKENLRLIQIKATKSKAKFSKLKEEIKKINLPNFCIKELWIWNDRKGWDKLII